MGRIEEIYRNIQETDDVIRKRREVELLIEDLLGGKRQENTKDEDMTDYEKNRDRFYEVAVAAEKNGFILGFQYAVQLMKECLKESLQNPR